MEIKDLSTFSTEELEQTYEKLLVDIATMSAKPELVQLFAAIEQELNSRK